MEEIRSLVCEDFELTKRDEPELIVFPLEKLDNQELDVCIKTNGFPNVSSSMKVIFPIQALVDEKEPIVTEKKLEYREITTMIASFGNFRLTVFRRKTQNNSFLDRILVCIYKASD